MDLLSHPGVCLSLVPLNEFDCDPSTRMMLWCELSLSPIPWMFPMPGAAPLPALLPGHGGACSRAVGWALAAGPLCCQSPAPKEAQTHCKLSTSSAKAETFFKAGYKHA